VARDRGLPVPDATRTSVRLKSAKGRIVVHVWPYATVTLDGKLLGSTPLPPIPASEGSHLLVIENTQLGARKEVRVRVRAGQSTQVKLTLE
jgi:serine/threonine-protein kinase